MWLRLLGAVLVAASTFLKALWRAAITLLHEATGAMFVLFAAIGAASAWREWQRGAAFWVISLSALFMLGMSAFAVASFRKAWRTRTENGK